MFLIFFLGLMSGYRIILGLEQKKIIQSRQLKFFLGLFSILIATISVLFQQNPILIWFFIIFLNFLLLLAPILIQKHRKKQFEQDTIHILSYLITSLKSGKSLRESIHNLQQGSYRASYYFTEIFQSLGLSQTSDRVSSDPDVQRIYLELLQIAKAQHRVVDRLTALRRTLKTEFWFQERVKQALLQGRVQTLVMFLLFVCLLSYLFFTKQLQSNLNFVFIASFLYGIGLFWAYRLGSQYQWKD